MGLRLRCCASCSESLSGERLGGNHEHVTEHSAEGEVVLSGPVFLSFVQVTGQLDEAVGDVGLDNAREIGWGQEDGGPGLKSGDVSTDGSAVCQQSRECFDDDAELLDSSSPLVGLEVREDVVGVGGFGLAVVNAELNLGEMVLVDDAVDDTSEECVVLVGGKVRDGLSDDELVVGHV